MFERYTERARRVLFFARYEASQLGSLSIEPEHLLLGLLREGKGLTSRVFASAHLSPENVRREIEGRTTFREKLSTSVEIPFSAQAKRILMYTAEESDRLLHNYIGTEHLLLGILREERCVAASILHEKGIRLESVRDDIVRLLKERQPPDDGVGQRPHGHVGMPGAPAIAPSYELHVSRSAYAGHATTEGADYWTASGFTLRSVLARLFETEERRIDLPADLDTEDRYDFVLRVPAPESHRTMERRVVEGIARHFTVSITRESRAHEVYVLTAPNGPASALRPEEPMSGGGVGFGSVEIATLTNGGHSAPDPSLEKRVSFGNLRMSGLTIGDLCRTLEEVFGRPFVDETGLAGTYELAVVGEFGDADGFFAAMRDQLGLVVAPAHRHLDVIVVRRR